MIVPLCPSVLLPRQNGCVFSGDSSPIVARRTCTLKMRPRASAAPLKSSSAYAASGNFMSSGCAPSARSYTAMPQPESWSSDCRISGFSASSSSCRIETGSAATQPNTRHMAVMLAGGRILSALRFAAHGHPGSGTAADLVGATGQAVRARAAGRRHRPERRAAEIAYLKSKGVRMCISTMASRHNLGAYQDAGLEWHHVPVESAQRGADALDELLPLLRRELRRRGAVAVHGDRHTDFVAAVCAAHLHEARGVEPAEALAQAARAGLTVNGYTCALLGVEPSEMDALMRTPGAGA